METRICKTCQNQKTLDSFCSFLKNNKTYYPRECNNCKYLRKKEKSQKEGWWRPTSKDSLEKIKESGIRSIHKYRTNAPIMREKLMQEIGQTSCIKCGYSNALALAFHHRNPNEKQFRIARGISCAFSFQRLLDEAKKCDVLCHNCHLETHSCSTSIRSKVDREKRHNLMEDIKQTQCQICSQKNKDYLTFHHRDPHSKVFEITAGLHRFTYSKLLIEARKCDVLCHNCHHILHAEQRKLLHESKNFMSTSSD